MHVVCFADGSTALGAGHQIRLAALAIALRWRGTQVTLVCRDQVGSAHGWAWAGQQVLVVSGTMSPLAAIESALVGKVDALVVDHYGLDTAALTALAARVPLAIVDDQPGSRALPVGAMVVNPAPGIRPSDYPDVIPAVGPAHALLRPGFAGVRRADRPDGVLLLLGATDPGRHLPGAASALLQAGWPVTVVASPTVSSRDALDQLAAIDSRLVLAVGLDAARLGAAMARHRVVVTTPSAGALEAAATGSTLVAVLTAANQERFASGLAALGIPVLRAGEWAHLSAAVTRAVATGLVLRVDGQGARRVADRLTELGITTPGVHLRPGRFGDADLLLAWANDPSTRAGSFRPEPITRSSHLAWMERQLADPEGRLWVAEAEGLPVGTVRLAREGATATVSIAVAPEHRGQGWGGRLLAALAIWVERTGFVHRMLAWVREDNPTSRKLFLTAGYREVAHESFEGHAALRLELSIGASGAVPVLPS